MSLLRIAGRRGSALRYNLAFNCVMLALLGIGIGLVSLLLGATHFGLPLFFDYFSSWTLIILNLLPPVLIVFLVYFLSGRAWIAFTFPALLIFALSTVHFFKVQIHGDAFIFSDIVVAREVAAVVTEMSLTFNWKNYLTVFALVCGTLFSIFVLKRKLKKIPPRMIAAAAVAAVSLGSYFIVYTDADLYQNTSVRVPGMAYSRTFRHISKGFMYPFVYSIHQAVSVQSGIPEWYDAREGRRLSEQYASVDIPSDRKVNMICLMLESYADFTKFDVLDFEVDVYAPLNRLREESFSGEVITNVFAGWTIDTERLFLTGNSSFISYNKPTSSYVHFMRSQGYVTEGYHAGDSWFYDRKAINSYMGFDRYLFRDSIGVTNRDDSVFFQTVMDLYQQRDRSKPYFNYSLSFQNHVGFASAHMLDKPAIAQGDITDESFKILVNFLAGIYDTSWRLEEFINTLRGDPEPVVVVVFGDHLPWLGQGASVYNELGININRDTEEGFFNRFSTPYFIWANDAAKETLGNDFTGDGGSFSTYFLMGKAFELCSWEGPGHMQALRELQTIIDISTPASIFRENGVLTDKLSPDAADTFRSFRQMEIYRRENFSPQR